MRTCQIERATNGARTCDQPVAETADSEDQADFCVYCLYWLRTQAADPENSEFHHANQSPRGWDRGPG